MTAFFVIVTIILILILLVLNTISTKINFLNINKSKNLPIHETPEFQAGLNHGFSLIQIALYKMWDDKSILDFDSLSEDIKSNLQEITKTPDNYKEWNEKFAEYLKSKKKGSSDDVN